MRERLNRWGPLVLVLLLLTVVVVGLATARPARNDRAQSLEQRLRCPVCKTVSIAESPSETASRMRRIVAAQVAAGRNDQQIITYFENRYGPWVLQDPPAQGRTLLLWVLVAAGAAGGLAVLAVRARVTRRPVAALSEADRRLVSAAVADFKRSSSRDDEP